MREKDIQRIRDLDTRLNSLSDEELAELYHQWSEIHYSASWLEMNERTVKKFVCWATTAPCDKYM